MKLIYNIQRHKLLLFIIMILYNFSLCGQSVNDLPLKLRVATYNVGHFNQGAAGGLETSGGILGKERKERYARLEMLKWREWISNQSLDFFCVQEWNRYFDADHFFQAEDELLKPFYKNIYWGDEHIWIYNGIVTNYNLTNLRQKYWADDYYALIGDLKIGDKVITIISTHIPWQKETHARALDSLMAELKKYKYLICMGDMNAKDAEQLHFKQEGFNIANGGFQGWLGTSNGAVELSGYKGETDTNLDNIITSPNIKIMKVSAPKTGLNDQDHLPIIADLIITW